MSIIPLLFTLPLSLAIAVPIAPGGSDEAAVRADIDAVYAPYFAVAEAPGADSEALPETAAVPNAHFAPALAGLVSRWREAIKEAELTAMSGYDWFCQCQDWDSRTGSYRIEHLRITAPDITLAKVRFVHGVDDTGTPVQGSVLALEYRKAKDGKWSIADMVFEGGNSLTNELTREIRTKGL